MRICVKDATPLVDFYSVVKIQIMGSGSASMQSRLIDCLAVVGVRKPTVDSTETRLLLRRFPQKDHKDFVLPGEVVFFLSTGRMQYCIEKVFFARSELVRVYVD